MTRPKGIDISYAQATFPARAEHRFVIIRISSGDGGLHEDSRAAQHIGEARARKMPMAFYHFMGTGGAEEARFAVAAMQRHGVWGHKLIIDAENDATPEGVAAAIREAKQLLRPSLWRFRRRRRVGIYSGYWCKSHGGGTFGADFGWLADYNAFEPPAHWPPGFTKLWQFTSNNGTLDENYWMGIGDYRKFFQPIDKRGYRV